MIRLSFSRWRGVRVCSILSGSLLAACVALIGSAAEPGELGRERLASRTVARAVGDGSASEDVGQDGAGTGRGPGVGLQPNEEGPGWQGARGPDQVEGARVDPEPWAGSQGEEARGRGPVSGPGAGRGEFDPPPVRFLYGPFGMRAPVYRYPEELLRTPWNECRRAFAAESVPALQAALNRLFEARLDTGFPNAPLVAALLVREGYRALDRGDLETARLAGQSARDLAPDFFPVYDFLSRLAGRDGEQGLGPALAARWESFGNRWRLFAWQFAFAGRVWLLLLVSSFLLFLFLGPWFLVRYGRLLLHALGERMAPGVRGRVQVACLAVLCLLVLLLFPGPLWAVVMIGMLLGLFLNRGERAVFSLGLLFLALAPLSLGLASRLLASQPPASRVLCECLSGDWDASCDQDLAAALAGNPESWDLLLAQALLEKRRGEVERAAVILRDAVVLYPESGPLWNNLGNLLAFQGDLTGAKDAYTRAIRWNPGIASPHHNLSQLLRREFSFLEGGRAFQEARRIDPGRVDFFSYIHSQNPNRFFMDESPPVASCWRQALARIPPDGAVPDALWAAAGSGVPLGWAPWVFGPLAVVPLLAPLGRRRANAPLACSGCGVVLCAKCHSGTAVTKMCTPCYQALYGGREIPKERRNSQIRKMAQSRAARQRRLALANALLPGLGFSLVEGRLVGYLLFFLFLFLALAWLFWTRLLPMPVVAWEGEGRVPSLWIAVTFLALYAAVQVRFRYKIRAGR